MKVLYVIITLLGISLFCDAQCNISSIFANDSTNAFCYDVIGNVRKCYTNDIPSHPYGPFAGPNTIASQEFDYSMCLYPELDTIANYLIEDTTSQGCGGGIVFGVSEIGINYSPFARLYFVNPNTMAENLNFHQEAVNTLNMDLNGGHVNVLGRYHYHSAPLDYFTNGLNITGGSHSPLLGYAADGFPIYYKYLYSNPLDSTSSISSFQSGYSLKTGNRSGNGITAPNGAYDGTYYEDYEYINAASKLDECGGQFGVTPEYPKGTYYYVLTDNWPYIPRCLKGKYPDNSFKIGPNCPGSNAAMDCSQVPIVSVDVVRNEVELKAYPNPANNYLKISIEDGFDKKVENVRIYNLNAQTVYVAEILESEIQVSHFPAGVYFLQINFGTERVTKKILIK